MAYDKVVDSAVLDAGLKQIADAIREKGGTSGNLAFPAAMAEAIAAIQAGGGNIASGKFTVGDDITSDVVITHGLGVKPYFLIVVAANNKSGAYRKSSPDCMAFIYAIQYMVSGERKYAVKYQIPGASTAGYGEEKVSFSDQSAVGAYHRIGISDNAITLRQVNISSEYGLGAGQTFFWVAIGEAELQ